MDPDRHKGKRQYSSGSKKRKIVDEREQKIKDVSKMPRITEFFRRKDTSNVPKRDIQMPGDVIDESSVLENIGPAPSTSHIPESEKDITLTNHSADNMEILTASQDPPDAVSAGEGSTVEAEANNEFWKKIFFEKDIALWPDQLTSDDIDSCIRLKVKTLQNSNKTLLDLKSAVQTEIVGGKPRTRKCSKSLFIRKTKNGETVRRSWLCFSPSTGRVFCSICKLFSEITTQFTVGGFCDWKNGKKRLINHEISKQHLKAAIDFASRSKAIGRIDRELVEQMEKIRDYWRKVLRRVISVITYLGERGMAFRGKSERLQSPDNGNFLGILELLSEYDDFLKEHIQEHGNKGSGHTNYLSSTTCEEVLALIGKAVLEEVISRVKKAKYFSVSLDSTTDEGHVDQLSFVLRYLEGPTPVERFLTFMPNQGHKARDMFASLTNFLIDNDLDIQNIRGQSYDNASAMSGKYNGLQALVQETNSLAAWIPCAGHSLNLVLQSAASCCLSAIRYFDFLEELYVYFTASTNRYEVLCTFLRKHTTKPILIPKRTTTTRWSCRADATKALLQGYKPILLALESISEDLEDTPKSRATAEGLQDRMLQLETALYTVFWDDILGQVNNTSKSLQNPRMDLNTAGAMLVSLKAFIASKRDSFADYEEQAIQLTGTRIYEGERKRKRKISVLLTPLDCKQAPAVELSASETFKTQSFIPVVDQLGAALTKRLEAYSLLDARFGFLRALDETSDENIILASKSLVDAYPSDIGEQLGNELIHFKSFINQFTAELKEDSVSKEQWMYQLMLDHEVKDSFPNVELVLRIYLTLMITNCSAERSFSKLKLLLNRLRTSMLEPRLNILAIISLESDILREIDHESIIEAFIHGKTRRRSI